LTIETCTHINGWKHLLEFGHMLGQFVCLLLVTGNRIHLL
jgi:hypothetical protein